MTDNAYKKIRFEDMAISADPIVVRLHTDEPDSRTVAMETDGNGGWSIPSWDGGEETITHWSIWADPEGGPLLASGVLPTLPPPARLSWWARLKRWARQVWWLRS